MIERAPHRFWRSAAVTHPGRERAENQDRFLALPSLGLFLVADGMGGPPGGALAADLAVGLIAEAVEDTSLIWPATIRPPRRQNREELLAAALQRASLLVFRRAEGTQLAGMGATVVAMLADGPNAVIAHLGDSRLYRCRQGALALLTEDHNDYNEQARRGATAKELAAIERPRLLTRVVGGSQESAWPDYNRITVETGDIYLLCSDGVYDVIGEGALRAVLGGCSDLDEVACAIVEMANHRGGPDNITAVIVRAEERL